MAKLLKLRRGTTTQHASFTGAEGEVTIDTTKDTAVVHDGAQAGGRPLLREDMSNLPAGTIDNADINASAAIAGTKISPNFGSQNITTTGTIGSNDITITNTLPSIDLVDSDNNSDFKIQNANGSLLVYDTTNSASRLSIASDGTVDVNGNLDANQGIDVTGNITSTGNINATGAITSGGDITISSTQPNLVFTDTDSDSDYRLSNANGSFQIYDTTNSAARLTVNSNGQIDIAGNTELGGNLTISNSAPKITFTDSNENPDFYIETNGSQFLIQDATNSAQRLRIQSDGTVDINGNTNFGAGIDVTGNVTVTGTVDGRDVASDGGKIDELYGGSNQLKSTVHINNGATATTQSAGDNSIKIATTAYADTAVAN